MHPALLAERARRGPRARRLGRPAPLVHEVGVQPMRHRLLGHRRTLPQAFSQNPRLDLCTVRTARCPPGFFHGVHLCSWWTPCSLSEMAISRCRGQTLTLLRHPRRSAALAGCQHPAIHTRTIPAPFGTAPKAATVCRLQGVRATTSIDLISGGPRSGEIGRLRRNCIHRNGAFNVGSATREVPESARQLPGSGSNAK